MKAKKVAIVHDWLYGGGAEQVVLELHRMYPQAPIYTSYATTEWRNKLDDKVVTGYLNRWPFSRLRKFLPLLRQRWFAKLDLSEYDLVLSSSGNGEAKFVQVKGDALHICYCHTPTHFYWRHYDKYLEHPGFRPYWLVRFALRLLVKPLRRRDYQAAQRVDYFVANSSHIRDDIRQYYQRESTVVFPPVDVERFKKPITTQRSGFVTHGRQVPYKRFDLLIEACNEAKVKLTVIGRGPEHQRLKQLAGPTVKLRNDVDNDELPKLLAKAKGYLFAAHEDFGIAPVEAMAAGTPVAAYEAGGALDYVIANKTGVFFAEQSVAAIIQAIDKMQSIDWDYDVITTHARAFSAGSFRQQMAATIKNITTEHAQREKSAR